MPGTIGNRNSMRHGLRAGRLPKGAAYIRRETDRLRSVIECAVVERHGEISVYHAAIVQTCIRWERHAMLAQRWMRLEAGDMDASTRLAYSREIARASSERDKCLRDLGLDARAASIIDALYSSPQPSADERSADDAVSESGSADHAADGDSAAESGNSSREVSPVRSSDEVSS